MLIAAKPWVTACTGACALFAVTPGDTAPIRVACLGDSITFGARLPDRAHSCYPSVLGRMLGPEYKVRNFGAGGTTLLQEGDRPYNKQAAYREAVAFRPDIALIMLGTNDTCAAPRGNWEKHGAFASDARALPAAFRRENPGIRLILCAPPDMRLDQSGLAEARKADLAARRPRLDRIRVWLREAAAAERVEFADMRYTTWSVKRTVDGVHPTPAGAEAIARRACEAIRTECDPEFRVSLPDDLALRSFSFHGFPAWDFRLDGVACKLARPARTAAGRPWVWRARFWGHEPQADLALLERGFHVAYCDVSDLFGAPPAVARWDRFHAFMREQGFAPKPFIEGMSRGGLIIHNWAAANPEKVSGLYCDNGVLDIGSWPGGLGIGQGSKACWTTCLKVYGFANEKETENWKGNPLDKLAPLARAHIPILYLMGMADTVVPPVENGEIAVRRYRALGGPVEVIRKPGLKHHPHSLPDPSRIVDFVLKATGRESH